MIYGTKLIASGLMLGGCLAVLAGCGGGGTSAADKSVGQSQVSVPAPPADLAATAGNAAVTLQWSASDHATAYNVKRSTTNGGPYTQLAAPASPGYTDSSVTNGTTYYYVVSALDVAGESADSAQASATPDAGAVPGAPTNLQATPGNAQASLTWSASSGATGYNVKRSTTSGGPYTQIAAPTSTSYTDTSVTNGTTYYYVVSALDAAGESPNSAQVSALPDDTAISAPPVPEGLSANSGSSLVSLAWSASSGATSYHVKRSTTSGGPYAQIAAPTSAAYADSSVTNGTTYYYVVSALDSAGESADSAQVSAVPTAPSSSQTANACGMQLGSTAVIFCDTFDAPANTGTRSGDLDGNVWGVSRTIGDTGLNFGQHEYDQWNPTAIEKCDGTTPTVNAPNDVIICNGQVREATNDNNSGVFDDGDVIALGMYPKQPFDFAGRTGTVSFDVSNDSTGTHAAWPEFWMSDLPVPVPFSHFGSWTALPANGFGIRMGAVAPAGMEGSCPNTNNLGVQRWTVDSAIVVRNYVMDDTNPPGYGTRTAMAMKPLDCVTRSSGPGNMNHVEIRVSQNQIDVYATDAGVAATPTTLKHIATVTSANLTFTKGLVWLEDVHYNADKETSMLGMPASTSQRQHTFSWDNLAFDGPFTDRDFAYDAPDNNVPGINGAVNLGKFSEANQTSSWSVPNLPANPQAAAARVLFDFNEENNPNPTTLTVIVNGNVHTVGWPYPDQIQYSWRTFAVTIPLTDLKAGTNVVQLGANVAEVFANVDIVLGDVTGGVPVLPGSNNNYPSP